MFDDCCLALPPDDVIFGCSQRMAQLKFMTARLAKVDVPVLVCGETGSGKEILARCLHRAAASAASPFVKISCAAIPSQLLEAELFGYEAGAFTGANAARPGLVESADGGTLLLDDIAELDVALQAKLLQFLQEGRFMRLGGEHEHRVHTRVICITSRNLQQELERGGFRQDLHYRIAGATLRMPALRERIEDIPAIADYLLRSFNQSLRTSALPLSGPLHRRLQRYHWPGNIRELENIMRRYAITGSAEAIAAETNRRVVRNLSATELPEGEMSLKLRTRYHIRRVEAEAVLEVLRRHDWNRRRAAAALHISYRALLYKMRDAGISANKPTRPELN